MTGVVSKLPGRQVIKSRDIAEIAVGSLVLAFPVAITEAAWRVGEDLSMPRAVLIALGSLVFIAYFVHTTYGHDLSFSSQKALLTRVFSVYGLTLLVSAMALLVIDKLPLFTDPATAINRTIVIAFSASLSATVVDSIGDAGKA